MAEHIADDMKNDPVFTEEQAHLDATYNTILSMERAIEAQMAKTRADAEEDKKNMADEVASNFASEGEAQETYIEYANVNSVVDAYNQLQSSNVDKLSRINILKTSPYFAKVVLRFKKGAEPKELYIGNVGLSDENYRRLVVDWRSPVAEVYYNQSNGATSYVANGRTINVDLQLRRQFDITENHLNSYFDTTVAIQDELLLASLSRQRTEKMQAITTTIQKEQNQVIRHEDVPALLVNGIAGSGKTSVLLQRIAYLFYQNRESLDPRQVFLVTPNPVFRRYIDNVLPDMGERNPNILTWDEFAAQVTPPGREFNRFDASPAVMRQIEEAVQHLTFNEKDFRDVKCQGVRLISAAQIARVAAKFKNIPAGPRLITLVREELEKRLTSRLGQMAGTDEAQDLVASFSHNEQLRIFGEPVIMDTEEQARDYTLRYLNELYADAFETVRNDHWLRVDRIGKRLLGIDDLSFLEWLYLKIACSGMGNDEAKFVMIDEVQDYTVAQLAVLARYYSRAHFLLLGDENQAIKPNTASFKAVREVFEETRGEVSECHLMTSYRSTPAITELFARLAPEDERMQITSVQRDDEVPVIVECADAEAYRAAVRKAAADAESNEGLTAVIAADDEQMQRLRDILGLSEGASEVAKDLASAVVVVDEAGSLPAGGTILLPLPLAKGLEFDQVVIAEASEATFPDDELSRRRLYTAISRATKSITLIAEGELTPLLK